MGTYTFSGARQKFAAVLEQAWNSGEVRIRRRDGQEFTLKPIRRKKSPLDVKGIDLSLSTHEIVDIVREIRER